MIEYGKAWDDKLDGNINLGFGVSKKRFTTSVPYRARPAYADD
jgi:hypothetical protein